MRRPLLLGILPLVCSAALLAGGPTASASPAGPVAHAGQHVKHGQHGKHPKHHGIRVKQRGVKIQVANVDSETYGLCGFEKPDNRGHLVHGTLVGPAKVLRGYKAVTTINILVHDDATGGWFFHLRSTPAYDYATQLAKHGQTSLVLDRLGYAGSPLANGNQTCEGAQVEMLHQVVQNVEAGLYGYAGGSGAPPSGDHVVVQGHGTGATIAQIEAATYRDTDATVLMSPASSSTTSLARAALNGQTSTCRSATFAPFGSVAQFRSVLFHSAPAAVQQAAARLRNPTPCGDVGSLAATLAFGSLDTSRVPTLLLRGADDARNAGPATVRVTGGLTTRTLAGTGNALPLERSAPQLRSIVVRWLRARHL